MFFFLPRAARETGLRCALVCLLTPCPCAPARLALPPLPSPQQQDSEDAALNEYRTTIGNNPSNYQAMANIVGRSASDVEQRLKNKAVGVYKGPWTPSVRGHHPTHSPPPHPSAPPL